MTGGLVGTLPGHPSLRAYRWAVVTAAAGLLGALLSQSHAVFSGGSGTPAWGLAFFAALAMAAELSVLHLPRYGVVSLAEAAYFAVMVLYGPRATVLLVLAAGIPRFVRVSRQREVEPAYALYGVAQSVLSFGIGGWLYAEYARPGAFFSGGSGGLVNLAAFAGAVAACFLVQSLLGGVHQWIDQRVGAWGTRVNWQRLRLYLQALGPLGLLLVVAFQVRPMAAVLLLGPLAVTFGSLKRYADTLREARLVIENLAEAVEKRDPDMGGHSVRVAAYAEEIARELGLSEAEVARVAAAGRLHDLGKISVADEVLMKMEELKEEEFEAIQRHTEVGAQVAAQLSLSREEARLIRHHHEHYDGSGYPDGLRGEAIPLGARILALAEAFDHMTTPRSYREALSREEAMARLEAGTGSQFDPRVVEAFRNILQRKWGLRPRDGQEALR